MLVHVKKILTKEYEILFHQLPNTKIIKLIKNFRLGILH